MIDVNIIITKLQADTAYTIEPAREKEPNLQDLSELPIIFVGYASIDSKNPNAPIEHDIYNTYGEDLVQSFDIFTVCTIAELPVIWKTIYKSLIGYTPTLSISGTAATSGFTYAQGGLIGLSNGKLWHIDRWRIGFPTVPTLF